MQKADARPLKRDGVSQKRPTIDHIPESLEERPGGGSRLIRALLATPAKVKTFNIWPLLGHCLARSDNGSRKTFKLR